MGGEAGCMGGRSTGSPRHRELWQRWPARWATVPVGRHSLHAVLTTLTCVPPALTPLLPQVPTAPLTAATPSFSDLPLPPSATTSPKMEPEMGCCRCWGQGQHCRCGMPCLWEQGDCTAGAGCPVRDCTAGAGCSLQVLKSWHFPVTQS